MTDRDDFYIGWQENTPESFKKTGLIFFISVWVIGVGFVIFFANAEVGFIDSYFDYGHLTEVKGHLVTEPVAALITEDKGKRVTIPLVGFGKFGAEPVLESFKEQLGEDISDDMVTIRGTYFEYQGKRWMELTEGHASLVNFSPGARPERNIYKEDNITLSGEIVDPKCFFGVMNPGTKAVHRSCARRCISGGIVPVLAIREQGEFVDYYLLQDSDSENIFSDILPYVGLPISISGRVIRYDDWKVLEINNTSLLTVQASQFSSIARCEN